VNFIFRGRFTNVDKVGQVYIKLYISSNNQIFTNAGTWVANGVYNKPTGYWLDPNLIEEWVELSFSLNVNNLPSTLPTQMRFEVDVLNVLNQSVMHTCSNPEADVRVLAELDSKSLVISVEDNASTSSVELELPETAINVFAADFSPVKPRVWNGTAWVAASKVWPTDSLHQTVLRQLMNYYDKPAEIYEGDLWRDYVSPLNLVGIDGSYYIVLDCERDYRDRVSKVTAFKDQKTTRIVVGVELPIGKEPPFVGNVFGPGNIGMQGVTAAMVKEITGSEVSVFSVPVTFEPGTNLILANPYSGQSENVVVSSQIGTNIYLNQAPSGSYPEGSVLIITPIEVLRLLSN
jgi:hypothetical protein